MRTVVPPFARFQSLLVSNVYLLDGGKGDRWLVDCGHWTERYQLLAELRRTGFTPRELTGVLLTHRHSDHAGNAEYLQREFGLKIYAHQADAEVMAGTKSRYALARRGAFYERMLGHIENRWPVRVQVDGALENGQSIASLEVHWVPGHTEGSVFFRHAGTGCLLTGDTLLTPRPPLSLVMDVVPPYPAYSIDLRQAWDAIDRFHQSGFAYEHVLAGHGTPLVGNARQRVLRALQGRVTRRY
jgi:glyoxylase-like metal-dependent hydrolase (beta-lactamase superfamily II)